MSGHGAQLPVIAAMAANFGVAVAKFVAAAFTGSSSMVSEGVHSLVDTGDSVLLLIGYRLSRRPPDREHPFGHGKETYVWTLVVAVLLFAVGAGLSIYEGVHHIRWPEPLTSPVWNYAVLGVAFVFECVSWVFAVRNFRQTMQGGSVWDSVMNAVDPAAVAVLLEDSAAILGLVLAAAGTGLTNWTGSALWDGAASVLIGLLLAGVAVILLSVSRRLLLGQAADPETLAGVRRAVLGVPGVREVGNGARAPLTMHLGPDEIMLALSVEFDAGVNARELPATIREIERRVRGEYPRIKRIFVEADSLHRDAAPR